MYAEGFWLFAFMLLLLKRKKEKKELKQNFYIATAQTGCYMNHHKTGNPQNLRLYAESKGNTLRVAGRGWSSPVYVIESAQMRRGCRTELCLETQHASQSRRSLFHLYASQDEKTCLAHVVSLDLAEQLSSCWDVCPAGIDV